MKSPVSKLIILMALCANHVATPCQAAGGLPERREIAAGLVNPESVVVGFDGRVYISEIGERDKDGDGRVSVISQGKVVPFATGLNDPKGITAVRDRLYVTDKTQVWSIDRDGKATVLAAKSAFPAEPLFLNDICADQVGTLYVSDSGLKEGGQGKVFSISPQGQVSLVVDEKRLPDLKRPNGLLIDRNRQLLIADVLTGALYRGAPSNGAFEKIAEGLGGPDGIVEDAGGNLFVSDVRGGRVFRVRTKSPEPVLIAEGFGSAADISMAFDGKSLLVPDMKNGLVVDLPVAPSPAAQPIYRGLVNPESIVLGDQNTYYVTVIGEFQKDGDGVVMKYPAKGNPSVFASGLDDPKGIERRGSDLFVTDKTRVVKLDKSGALTVFAAAEAFPTKPLFLNDIAFDSKSGSFFVSDSGDLKGNQGAVFEIARDGKITTVIDSTSPLPLKGPNGVLPDGQGNLWVADFVSGDLLLVNLASKKAEKIVGGLPGGDGLVLDHDGNLYISQWSTGQVSVLPVGAKATKLIANQFVSAADMCIDPNSGRLLVPDMKAGTVTPIATASNNPTNVDETPLEVRIEQVFTELQFDRPIVLTHANDGSDRVFIGTQRGQIFVVPNDPSVTEAKLFLDLREKIAPYEKGNEEGFLGFAFHPKFKQNGQFFIYYTAADMNPRRSVVSRFTVDPNNPNAGVATSEQVVIEIPQPYSNHNGGTIAFGPDGYLYIGLGDGGSGGDPHGNGQKMDTVLGKILRIDVDHKSGQLGYAIPKDNPFVGQQGAAPEIWAVGVRNIWRLSFDRQTGDLWAGEVGQNIWEEVNLITRGGNYGWKPRESMHKFSANGSEPKPEYIEPVWEYHHEIGKSITGGNVYRGKKVPELAGYYLYADYVTGRLWGLKYDVAAKKVLANKPIAGNIAPVLSFGEDQNGEIYYLTVNGGIFRFTSIPQPTTAAR